MTIKAFLHQSTRRLQDAGIETPRLDVLVLLEDALHKDRASLLAHSEAKLPFLTEVGLYKKIIQRADHIPLAYIRGKVDFYGRTFTVSPDVLVPRPETEAMIGLLKATDIVNTAPLQIADVGTGSGCLGITAALEIPGAQVDLYDIDSSALGLALKNAKAHNSKISAYCEDLLTNAEERRYDVILANLPYVPTTHAINKAASHEPALAIFSGPDGLDAYRTFWLQLGRLTWQPRYIFTESLTSQHDALKKLAEKTNYKLAATSGLVQKFKRISS